MKGNLAKTAGILALSTALTPNAEAMKAYNKVKAETNKNKIELASEMITQPTHDKVLQITAFTKQAKSRENLDGDPPSLEKILVAYDSLKGNIEGLQKFMNENGITREILQKMYDELQKKYDNVEANLDYRDEEIREYNTGHSEEYQKDTQALLAPYRKKLDKIIQQQIALAKMMNVLNLPQESEKIGKTLMDPVFEKILKDPRFAGTVKDNPELNELVFAEFPPEAQKLIKQWGLILKVEKDGERIKVYFECGKDKNGEIYKVKFLDSKRTNIVFELIKAKEYGLVISETATYKGITKTQQIREISPTELEDILIGKDGEIEDVQKITKFSTSNEKVVNN